MPSRNKSTAPTAPAPTVEARIFDLLNIVEEVPEAARPEIRADLEARIRSYRWHLIMVAAGRLSGEIAPLPR